MRTMLNSFLRGEKATPWAAMPRRLPPPQRPAPERPPRKALAQAAQTLVTSCTTDTFTVSFVVDTAFPPPAGRNRLYMQNAEASQAAVLADSTGLEDPSVRVVFLTEFHDTRFDAYGVLRPLSTAE